MTGGPPKLGAEGPLGLPLDRQLTASTDADLPLSRSVSQDTDALSESCDYNSCFFVPPPPNNVRRIYHNRKKTSYTDYAVEVDTGPKMTVIRLLAEEPSPSRERVCGVAFAEGTREENMCLPLVLETPDVRGWVPLLIAVRQQQADAVEALLSLGADPNVIDPETGYTPLIIAVTGGDTSVVRHLLDHGAVIDVFSGDDGRNPLCEAILARRADLIDMLLEAGGSLELIRRAVQARGERYPELVETFERHRVHASRAERLCAQSWMPGFCSVLVGYTWHVTMPSLTC